MVLQSEIDGAQEWTIKKLRALIRLKQTEFLLCFVVPTVTVAGERYFVVITKGSTHDLKYCWMLFNIIKLCIIT